MSLPANVRAYGVARPREAAWPFRTATIVAAYTLVFFGMLPALLWWVGARLDRIFALPTLEPMLRAGGAILAAAGAGWMAWSMLDLRRRGDGWPISHLPPRRLVRDGPYAVMRHPIYAGFVASFAGIGITAGSPGQGILAAALLAAGAILYAVGFEEPRLAARHGDAYRLYRARVGLVPGFRLLAWIASHLWAPARGPIERIANFPILFRTGSAIWVTYGALTGAGAAVMATGVGLLLVQGGLSPLAAGLYVMATTVAMVVGGRILWLLYHAPVLWREPTRALRSVGFVSWGSYLGLAGVALGAATLGPHGTLWYLDRALLPGLACSILGRLGCLTYGCCWGRPWREGIRWRHPTTKVVRELGAEGSVRRVPTPLLSSVAATLVLAVAVAATWRPIPAGAISAVILLLYAIARFGVECLREQPRYFWGLTSGQIGSLVLTALAIGLFLVIDGPPSWPRPATDLPWAGLGPGWVAVGFAGGFTFLACGLHWKRVGRW